MGFGKIISKAAPAMAICAMVGLSGCGGSISINGEEGVPLAELDMADASPSEVALISSDDVVIQSGDSFNIEVDGSDEAVERLRFVLSDDTIGVHHSDGDWTGAGNATITITMPPPNSVTVLGSGSLDAEGMSDNAEINLIGSGSITIAAIDAAELEISMPGSGSVSATGTAQRLDLNVLGSGSASMPGLMDGDAEVTVAGSGGAEFASDGTVEANIAGSGTVRVNGNATCTEESVGSGSLICETVETAEDEEELENAE